MATWDSYFSRLNQSGSTTREVRLNRERDYINRKIRDSLSFHPVTIDGAEREAVVINSDNLNEKTIISMPGEEILGGSIVDWADNHWIVTEVDPNQELYTKAIMLQCNHILKWINRRGDIVRRWCVIDDGTKYIVGQTSPAQNGVVLGDTRVAAILPRDDETVKLDRSYRFLIDDKDSLNVLAYQITKPFKIGGVYNGHGAMSFVLSEVNTEDDDNLELRIADYYKWFPRECDDPVIPPGEGETESGEKVWL